MGRFLGLLLLLRTCGFSQQFDAARIHDTNRRLVHDNSSGISLRQQLISSGGRVLELYGNADRGVLPNRRPEVDLFNDDVCAAAAVVMGTPIKVTGLLSSFETTVFTDYEIAIRSVLKNAGNQKLAANNRIMVSRPFGEVHLNEGIIKSSDPDYPPSRIGGVYILFLSPIPGTQSDYKSTDSVNTYLVVRNHAKPLAASIDAQFRAGRLFKSTLSQLQGTIASAGQACD